ncbi:hypothetical protein PDE_00249 [Penicillium oxalicum 114-2]|uniref:Short-chain dehydrogenase/reductase n=1 Tax=Penicillium oxalicum (strain 114-2 / CGMCC 5302) TaxID=933388 RepID=S7Z9H0_PENO1|nr:hypothetical protein PDE_00249 [Penicillium oxalicum 114-2]
MSTSSKVVLATGASSGLGFESVKQLLLDNPEPYTFILGARDVKRTQAAFDALNFDTAKNQVHIFPLDLKDLRSVQVFAQNALEQLGQSTLDFLFLAAGALDEAKGPASHGSQWCDGLMVNHLSQHYLIHLIRETLLASKTRVVFVSSGAIRNVRDQDPKTLDVDLKANSDAGKFPVYCGSKFVQLLGAHYWRRHLPGCTIVAVSPGLVPDTNLATGMALSMSMADAKTVPEGAKSLLEAFTRNDIPADPEQIFLTSWGEWWAKDVYAMSLDTELQDKWCWSREEIEKAEGLAAQS